MGGWAGFTACPDRPHPGVGPWGGSAEQHPALQL